MKGKIKYYLKQPRGAIAKDMLQWLAVAGAVVVAGNSPYFVRGLLRSWKHGKRHKLKSAEVAFYRMRKQGLISVERKNHQYHIFLTDIGKQKAGWLQLDALAIKRPKQWKGEWYFLMFDVAQVERWRRDVLRSFLGRLEFVLFQKSVWVHAHDCRPEVEVLKAFLGLTDREIKILRVSDSALSRDDSSELRRTFRI